MALAPAPLAQVDTLRTGLPGDTLERQPVLIDTVDVAPNDTLEVPVTAPLRDVEVVLPPAPEGGRLLTPVPARAPAFSTAALLDPHPGAWRYQLGPPGAPDGVALGVTHPQRVALSLDGRPAEDLFTGRPAFERLPADVMGPLRAAAGLRGSTTGVAASVRAYAAEVPISELRYRAGPLGHQFISATHAQTRRPGLIERVGGERARLGILLHVHGDRAGSGYVNSELGGFELLGRLTAALPGIGIEIFERYRERSEGAWGGVDWAAPSPFWTGSPVRQQAAEREVRLNDLAVRARAEVLAGARPIEAQLYWTAATLRYITPADTTEARGHRYGARVSQGFEFGDHAITLEIDARLGRVERDRAFGGSTEVLPPEMDVSIRDSLGLGGMQLELAAGAHLAGALAFPSARASIHGDVGPASLRAAAHLGGASLSAVERLGFGDHLTTSPAELERAQRVEVGLRLTVGSFEIGLSGEVERVQSPRLLLINSDLVAEAISLDGGLTAAAATLEVGFRQDSVRGLYATAWGTATRHLDADGDALARREAEAMPEFYGFGRLGVRALGMFDGSLDLDLFLRGRAWAAHAGRMLHPATGLLGLPPDEAPPVPAQGVLDVVIEGGLAGGRANVFLAFENALAGAAYPGVFVVPLYPLLEPRVRIGVFWVLPN